MAETLFLKSVLITSFWGLNCGMALPTRFKDRYSGKKNIQQFFGAVVPEQSPAFAEETVLANEIR